MIEADPTKFRKQNKVYIHKNMEAFHNIGQIYV